MSFSSDVIVIGGGLAGAEAAWQLAERGVRVELFEMRPDRQTPVHKGGQLAELVCSNSLKSLDQSSASGALKYELAVMGSKLLQCAIQTKVQAGLALAVDRDAFSNMISKQLHGHPNIKITCEEIAEISTILDSKKPCIVATGPMTSPALEQQLVDLVGQDNLAFFDAAAPIVDAHSINMDVVFSQSRYGKGGADYLNAAMSKDEYEAFIGELVGAEKVILKDFENKDLFQACQPVEEVARHGLDTLRYGALKPVGLSDPKTGKRPWAVVQLRAENSAGSAYNLVGFQTNLTFSEQKRVFRMIPGLRDAEFLRYGVMHRNTFINSPTALGRGFALKNAPQVRFAGQITGTEGYLEAIASGLLAALNIYAQLDGHAEVELPGETLCGALFAYASDPTVTDYQPMHVNYGIVPALENPAKGKKERYFAYSQRSAQAIDDFRAANPQLLFLPRYEVEFMSSNEGGVAK